MLADLAYKICVDDVFHIHGIKVVSPWMKDLEAFVVHVLGSESFDILLDELEAGLVGFDWVGQVILNNCFLVVSQE